MATRGNKPNPAAQAGVLEPPREERERIFDLFRRWGYLQADLDPLGLFKPISHPELEIRGEAADEARHYYCGLQTGDSQHHRYSEPHTGCPAAVEGFDSTIG